MTSCMLQFYAVEMSESLRVHFSFGVVAIKRNDVAAHGCLIASIIVHLLVNHKFIVIIVKYCVQGMNIYN